MTTKEKAVKKTAKRKIVSLDFSGDNHAVSLVGPLTGGAANGYETLITKSTRSEEFIKKASEVTVTLEITEFLRKFFYMYYEDAEVLARSLGYTTAMMDDEAEDAAEKALETQMETTPDPEDDYAAYIANRVSSFQIMKSLEGKDSVDSELSNLSDDEFLGLLKDQEMLESFVTKAKKPVEPVVEETQVIQESVTESTIEQKVDESEIEKSLKNTQVELEKATIELQKALDKISAFERKEKEQIEKSRFEEISKAVLVESAAKAIFEAVKESNEEVFKGVVSALTELTKAVESSDLFNETGTTVEETNNSSQDKVELIIKQKYQSKNN